MKLIFTLYLYVICSFNAVANFLVYRASDCYLGSVYIIVNSCFLFRSPLVIIFWEYISLLFLSEFLNVVLSYLFKVSLLVADFVKTFDFLVQLCEVLLFVYKVY